VRIEMFMPGLDAEALGAVVHQDFAAAVRARGHDFRIVTTGAGERAPRDMADVLPTSPMWRRVDAIAAPWLRTRAVLSPAAALARHLKTAGDRIDVLHVEVAYPFGTAAELGVAAAGWTGPVVITPMGEDTLVVDALHYGFRRFAVPRWLIGRTLGRAAALRCISPLHEAAIARLAPAVPRRMIPLNVTSAIVAASTEGPGVRDGRRRSARGSVDATLGTTGRPIVLSLGRLHPFKSVDRLIGALRLLPEAVLIIAGPSLSPKASGDEATRLSELVNRYALGDRVRMLGAVPPDRAMELLAAADVAAVPSRLESLNKVCVEAAAVGTPFVVTETTGISAWARDAGVGFVVPPDDEPALAEALALAVRQGPLTPAESAAFVAPFSPDRVAAEVTAFYESLVGAREARP
jgi:glycosyltransferase involved in cell wall biosynthesis